MKKHKEPKWTIEEALENVKEFERGYDPTFEEKCRPVGEIVNCNKCNKPTSVIKYTDDLFRWTNVVQVCNNCYEPRAPSPCEDEACEVHKNFDESKHYKEEQNIKTIQQHIEKVLYILDPKSDSILEYDKFKYIVSHSLPDEEPGNYLYWAYTMFIDYLALRNRLRK